MKNTRLALILAHLFIVKFLAAAVFLVAPQATDGDNWRFTLVVTNPTTTDAIATVAYFQDTTGGNTGPWSPPLDQSTAVLTIPAGSSVFIHSAGTASTLSQGFVEVTSNSPVQAYVIYTHTSGQGASQTSSDATAQAVTATNHSLVPIDNTGNYSSAIAVANPNPEPITISVNFNIGGNTTAGTPFTVPAMGHVAVLVASQFSQTSGQAGLMELYSTGTFAIISLRANNNPATGFFSFTSAPTYSDNNAPIDTPAGGGGGGGGGSIPAGDITLAGFNLGKITSTATNSTLVVHLESVGGSFDAFTPTEFHAPYSGTKIDDCFIYDVSFSLGSKYPGAADMFLNAGNVMFKGAGLATPATLTITNTMFGPSYNTIFPAGTLQDGATYHLFSPTGGTQILPFDVATTLPSGFTTNLQTINQIDRSQPLLLEWSGTGFPNVTVGADSILIGPTSVHQVVISCVVPASMQKYTLSTDILSHLLPVSASFTQASGVLSIGTAPAFSASQPNELTSFTPGLVGGGKVTYGEFGATDSEVRTLPII